MTAGEEACNEQIFKGGDIRLRCVSIVDVFTCWYRMGINEVMHPFKRLFVLHISFNPIFIALSATYTSV